MFADTYADVVRFTERRADAAHAEDVAAEVFVTAWRRFDDAPRTHGDQRAWLFGITRNCLLNARRGLQRRDALAVRIAEAMLVHPPPGESGPDLVALRVDLAQAWRRLDPGDQEVLALTVFEDLTSPQAGRVLGITSAAYRLRLMRARRTLRRHLDTGDEPTTAQPGARQETWS